MPEPSRRAVLLVAWLFPPHSSIGARRPWRMARHLPSFGWDPVVLCGREPPARFRDPTPAELPASVHLAPDYDAAWLTRLANRADAQAHAAPSPDETVPATPSRLARAQSWLGSALPTETIAAHGPHAFRAAKCLVIEQRCRAVWTTSYPYSAHLVGLALKRATGLPWVVDLRDPWTLNFVHDRKPAGTRAIERWMERRVFAHADAITVTTEALRDAYRERYPQLASRFVTIRNGFDPVALPPRALSPERVRFVHFGHVYGARTLEPFLRALAQLVARAPSLASRIVLENYGRLPPEEHALARALGLGEVVRAHDPLPYHQGLAALRSAHALLLPAWGTERGALMLPGKLYDYLLAGAPVLAVGENAELGRILAETHAGGLFAPGALDALTDALLACARGEGPPGASEQSASPYRADSRAAELAALLDSLTA